MPYGGKHMSPKCHDGKHIICITWAVMGCHGLRITEHSPNSPDSHILRKYGSPAESCAKHCNKYIACCIKSERSDAFRKKTWHIKLASSALQRVEGRRRSGANRDVGRNLAIGIVPAERTVLSDGNERRHSDDDKHRNTKSGGVIDYVTRRLYTCRQLNDHNVPS